MKKLFLICLLIFATSFVAKSQFVSGNTTFKSQVVKAWEGQALAFVKQNYPLKTQRLTVESITIEIATPNYARTVISVYNGTQLIAQFGCTYEIRWGAHNWSWVLMWNFTVI